MARSKDVRECVDIARLTNKKEKVFLVEIKRNALAVYFMDKELKKRLINEKLLLFARTYLWIWR